MVATRLQNGEAEPRAVPAIGSLPFSTRCPSRASAAGVMVSADTAAITTTPTPA